MTTPSLTPRDLTSTKGATQMEHTPGPWRVGERYGNRHTEITVREGERAIAYVWTQKPDPSPDNKTGATVADETGEANARLIAAAPDLLAALRSLVVEHIDVLELYNVADFAALESVNAARAAIAKATTSGERSE